MNSAPSHLDARARATASTLTRPFLEFFESRVALAVALGFIAVLWLFSWGLLPIDRIPLLREILVPVTVLWGMTSLWGTLSREFRNRTAATVGLLAPAIEVYGATARIRGRDVFGAVLQDSPAEEVVIIVTVQEVDGDDVVYNLRYTVNFHTLLKSDAAVQILVGGIVECDGVRDAIYRYASPAPYLLTFDFSPRTTLHEATSILQVAERIASSALDNSKVFYRPPQCDWQSVEGKRTKRASVLHARSGQSIQWPVWDGVVPIGAKEIRVEVTGLRHPRERFLMVESPLTTRALTVVCIGAPTSPLRPLALVCYGEGSQVRKDPVANDDARTWGAVPENVSMTSPEVLGNKWTCVTNSWVITPSDSVYVYLTDSP